MTGDPDGNSSRQRSPEYVTIHEGTIKEVLAALRTMRQICIGRDVDPNLRADIAIHVANLIGDIYNDMRAREHFTHSEVRHG